ncbi:MAG: hypothetical protein IKN72_06490 [Clostridia bacterium]|nr:hypothetical protein [Clostridia bacterium]
MLKKIIGVLLAVLVVCLCLLPAAAQNETGVITLKLNSNIAGCTERDVEQLIQIKSGNVVYGGYRSSPESVADYAGTADSGKLKAGRTYNIHYHLSAAEGYALPESVTADNVKIECDKGVKVISVQITSGKYREESGELVTHYGLLIYASVVVDGNIFQRVAGWFYDLILKARAWSLY